MKEIYNQTHFRITHNGDIIDFTIDTLPSASALDKPFAILTAWNPNNVALNNDENTLRNEQLFEILLERGYLFDEALGYLEDHSEESYCLYGVNFEEAIELGTMYDQYAIFYRSDTHAGYYECATKEAVTERSFS